MVKDTSVSDIFISYANQDRSRVRTLADALSAHGWSVWWDRQIPAGRTFDQVIAEALASARCVVVLWSRQSIQSHWVREEAEEGRKRGILIRVLLDAVQPPLGFSRIQAADLVHWDGTRTSEVFQQLATGISAILGPPPISPATQGTPTTEGPPRQEVEHETHRPRTPPPTILRPILLRKRTLQWVLALALLAVVMAVMIHQLGVFDTGLNTATEEPVHTPRPSEATRTSAAESALKLTAILTEGSEPLTGDLRYEVLKAAKTLEGTRERVSYSYDAAPLFKLPAGRYYVTVTHGSASAGAEVEVTAGRVREMTLEIQRL
jgi:hypothetical protein